MSRFVYLFVYIVIWCGILATGNRTCFLIGVFISALWLLFNRKYLILLLLLVLLSFPIYKKLKGLNILGSDRVLFSLTALEMWKEKPFLGVGLGNFKLHYLEYRDKLLKRIKYNGYLEKTNNVHNEYVQVLTETGILGFLSVCGIMFIYFKEVLR